MKLLLLICSYLLSRATVLGAPSTEIGIEEKVTESAIKGIKKDDIDVEGLKKDVLDILHMIPREKVTAIAMKHLKEDDGFKLAVKFMTEPEWVKLVQDLKEKPEWIVLKQHLDSFGIPVDNLIHCVDSFVKNITIGPVKDNNAKRNLTSFIEEVEGIIPVTEILMKFNEKMQSSPNLQLLLEKLSQPEFKKVFEDALKLPEIRKMLDELKNMGLNLYDLFSLLYIFLGWGEFNL